MIEKNLFKVELVNPISHLSGYHMQMRTCANQMDGTFDMRELLKKHWCREYPRNEKELEEMSMEDWGYLRAPILKHLDQAVGESPMGDLFKVMLNSAPLFMRLVDRTKRMSPKAYRLHAYLWACYNIVMYHDELPQLYCIAVAGAWDMADCIDFPFNVGLKHCLMKLCVVDEVLTPAAQQRDLTIKWMIRELDHVIDFQRGAIMNWAYDEALDDSSEETERIHWECEYFAEILGGL